MGLGINVFPAYVYIIFVYRVVYVDMSTRSSQLNHLNLEREKIYALGKLHMRSTPSFVRFPNVAFETVPVFV